MGIQRSSHIGCDDLGGCVVSTMNRQSDAISCSLNGSEYGLHGLVLAVHVTNIHGNFFEKINSNADSHGTDIPFTFIVRRPNGKDF